MELLEQILDKENLNKAYKHVKANKGAPGVDGVTVDEAYENIIQNKEKWLHQIRKRTYKPQPVRRVQIPKENGKMRNLGIPTVFDRIIQQSIVQVLSPIFEEQFSKTSYGFRPGRSCENAVVKALEHLNDGYEWIVDIDLERFFDTVDQDRLINIIMRTIKDGDVVSLIRKYLSAGVMDKGITKATEKGTPQGGNLSPLLSNIMLNELDKELEKRGLSFVRYADDCIILVKSEKAANRVLETVTKFIEKKLGLKVNAEKSKVTRPTQTKYLGFSFWKDAKGKWKPKPHLKSYQKIDEHLRTRIRAIIWKQWKKATRKEKALLQLGVKPDIAHNLANTSKGYQLVAKTDWMKFAINIERLRKRGLIFLSDQYQKVHIEI